MARWINVTKAPFDYRFADRPAIMAVSANGDHFVKDEVADFAVAKGYASEGKASARSRSRKGGAKRARSAKRKETVPAKAADTGPAAGVDIAGAADADRPADRSPVDHDAG